jgi:hypothetical protein
VATFQEHAMRTTLTILATAACLSSLPLAASAASAAPVVPGFNVTTYAVVAEQNRFTFDALGTLYIGNTSNAAGGAQVHRVGPGGSPVGDFGPALFDPDAVLFDTTGAVSGVAGSVLVGGDAITAIRPDQSAALLVSGGFSNVNDMVFDRNGRLLFTDNGNGTAARRAVFALAGGSLTQLFFEVAGAVPDSIAVNAANQIFTSRGDGGVSVHGADGTLINANFISALSPFSAIDFGRGGAFGDSLYALDALTGVLLRFDAAGLATVVGTGFAANSYEIAFGPDGALYVGDFSNSLVLRVAAVPEPGSAVLMLLGGVAVGAGRRLRR